MTCKICGSHAINQHFYDREIGVDTDLCDVHYWMKRAAPTRVEVHEITQTMVDDVESRVGVGCGAWDMVHPKEIIAAGGDAWL
jgi:hypothetical protein